VCVYVHHSVYIKNLCCPIKLLYIKLLYNKSFIEIQYVYEINLMNEFTILKNYIYITHYLNISSVHILELDADGETLTRRT